MAAARIVLVDGFCCYPCFSAHFILTYGFRLTASGGIQEIKEPADTLKALRATLMEKARGKLSHNATASGLGSGRHPPQCERIFSHLKQKPEVVS